MAWRVCKEMSDHRSSQEARGSNCIRCGKIDERREKIRLEEQNGVDKGKYPTSPHCNEAHNESQQIRFLLAEVFEGPEDIWMAGRAAFEKLVEPSRGWMKTALGDLWPGARAAPPVVAGVAAQLAGVAAQLVGALPLQHLRRPSAAAPPPAHHQ
jgi:hypothetical protein